MAFILILIVNFALFIAILARYKKKILFIVLGSLIIAVSIFNSYFILFKNPKINMFTRNEASIFSVEYETRRYFTSGKTDNEFLNLKNLVNSKIGNNALLGISISSVDWSYILFGDNFTRKVNYISLEDLHNKEIEDIIGSHKLDGLLVKVRDKNFGSPDLDNISLKEDIYKKLVEKLQIKIDTGNYSKYLKYLNQCEIGVLNDKIFLKILGTDPHFEFDIPDYGAEKQASYLIKMKIDAPVDCSVQMFYKIQGQNYSEKNSQKINLDIGEDNIVYFFLKSLGVIRSIRIDPINVEYDTKISYIEINELKNINFEILNNYLLFYD